jgi:pimeloyl-ACP methyl ester carboxylesterase
VLVGMSLGGITAVVLAARHPDLVPRLVLIDVTPGVDREKSSDIRAFLAGPESFASFDEILQRTVQFNPTRSESSLRRGVLHNAVQREDGSWTWRHQLGRPPESSGLHIDAVEFGSLWDELGSVTAPTLLVRGGLSPVVDDADVAEFRRRRPDAEVLVVEKAGHSIQGDQPLELARILDSFLNAG